MSGHRSGVQARIREIVGSGCTYIHCYAHRLNLVLINTVRCIREVDDFLGSWKLCIDSFHPPHSDMVNLFQHNSKPI